MFGRSRGCPNSFDIEVLLGWGISICTMSLSVKSTIESCSYELLYWGIYVGLIDEDVYMTVIDHICATYRVSEDDLYERTELNNDLSATYDALYASYPDLLTSAVERLLTYDFAAVYKYLEVFILPMLRARNPELYGPRVHRSTLRLCPAA